MRRFHHIVTKSTKSCQRLYSATIPLSPQFRHGAIGVTPARLADNTMKEHYVCAWAQRESNPYIPLRPIRPF